ncbi:suppressor of fused domain protein [Stieleria sp.]|uniref:suppressor of fused domain protein n=1 Tax=Stieleria sp. TaxID=2795976 RepID=UPI0035661387
MPDQVIPDQWYIKTKNGKRGPYSVQQLQRYVDAGAILPNSGVGSGQGPWVAAATVQGLSFSAESIAKVRASTPAAKSSVTTGNATDAALNQRAAELQSREQAVQDRAEELDARSSELDARDIELDARSSELDARDSELDARGTELDARSSELDTRDNELDSRGQELDVRANEFEQREQELTQREQAFEQREQAFEQREQELTQREQELTQREQEFEQREQEFEQREQEFEQREQELEERTQQLDQRESELGQQQQEIQCQSQELQQREADLQLQQKQLDARAKELDTLAGELDQHRELQAAREAEQATSFQQRETTLAQQQADDESKRSELEQRESDLAARFAETQQLEARLQAEQAELQQHSEELNQREEALADREQATRQLEQSLQEQQLAAADQAAPVAPPPAASDDARDASAESILEEKKRLLQEFADRQASLSRREAELIRRENELTRRELDSVVTHDATTESGWELEVEPEAQLAQELESVTAPEPAESVTTVQDSEPRRPVEPAAAESDSTSDLTSAAASSWQDVLGRAEEQPADFELAEYDGVSAERVTAAGEVAVATQPEDDRSDGAAAQTGLSELRRLAYEQRFGPCSRYDVDDDPSMRVDVSVHLPEDARDFTTLVTSGMSDYPIPMPNGQRSVRAELLLYVTHLDELAIQILRGAAKLPFRKKKGLSIGTTESLDGLRDQLSDSQQKDCVYMLPVVESDSKPIPAKEVIGGVVQLFWLMTITEAERKLIDTGGIHKFLSLLEKNNHAVFFDLMRDCYVKRKGWFRR